MELDLQLESPGKSSALNVHYLLWIAALVGINPT
jgi:hypothetical protein